MIAVWWYLLGIKPQWGVTAKEVKNTNFFREVKHTLRTYWHMYLIIFLLGAMMVCMAVLPIVPDDWKIMEFNAYFPLAFMVCGHMLMPILLNPGLMLIFY
jgi:fatty acid desaturase